MKWVVMGLLFIPAVMAVTVCHARADRPVEFVDLKDVAPSAILDMRYAGPHNFLGVKVDGYNVPKCLLTKKAAEALDKVQKDLNDMGFSLKVYDCYRPQRAVDHFVRWAKDIGDIKAKKEFYPTVDKANLFRDGYIAQKSSHSRGSTVDLTIVPLPTGEQEEYIPGENLRECYLPAGRRFRDNSMDMGTGFDCFHEMSWTKTSLVGAQPRMNRTLLKTLMERRGFINYDKEWWHYTLEEEPFPDTYFDFPVE